MHTSSVCFFALDFLWMWWTLSIFMLLCFVGLLYSGMFSSIITTIITTTVIASIINTIYMYLCNWHILTVVFWSLVSVTISVFVSLAFHLFVLLFRIQRQLLTCVLYLHAIYSVFATVSVNFIWVQFFPLQFIWLTIFLYTSSCWPFTSGSYLLRL